VVGPVNVFHHEERRHPPDRGQDGGKEPLARRVGLDAELRGDVVQRTEGSRREERLASCSDHPDAVGHAARQLVQQRGLADPRLADDGHDATAVSQRGVDGRRQLRQGLLALQQGHRWK
jgi:hypothetical protein